MLESTGEIYTIGDSFCENGFQKPSRRSCLLIIYIIEIYISQIHNVI